MKQVEKNLICICCPIGCNLSITKNNHEYLVTGNKCPRGKKYAIDELTAPKRIITSTVKITGSLHPVISVKTDQPVPKEKIFTIMKILATVSVKAPIKIGDIIVAHVANTEANIVATKEVNTDPT